MQRLSARLRLAALPALALAMLAPTAEARKWRDVTGVFAIEAELVAHDDTTVTLQSADGRRLEVPLSRLSREDRAYLAKLRAGEARGPVDPRRALSQPSEAMFADTPLGDAIGFYADRHRVRIFVDRLALEDEGIAVDSPVNASRRNVTLADALSDVLDPLSLQWTVRHGVIFVSTPAVLESMLEIRAYRAAGPANWDQLIRRLTTVVAPSSWSEVGGPATVSVVVPHLIVSQTRPSHEQIAKLFGKSLAPVRGPAPDLADLGLGQAGAALREKVAADLADTPLREAAALWAKAADVDIQLDARALQDSGVSADAPLTLHLGAMPLIDALPLALRQLELTWTVRRGAILVTTPEAAEEDLLVIRHRAADLLGPGPATAGRLTQAVKSQIAPATWNEVGGPATARFVAGKLEVRQTLQAHLDLAQLLSDLRVRLN